MIVAYVIVFPFVYFLPALAELGGYIDLPRYSVLTSGVASFLIAGVLTSILTPLNQRLLAWRKAHGRDIEAEERHETDSGMIRLTPNDGDR